MILFGRKAQHLGLKEISTEVCSKCGSKHQVISLFQKYFHVLWLPMFPLKRAAALQCLKCRNVELEKNFNEPKQFVVRELKKLYRAPYWTFTGLGIFLLTMILKLIF